MMNILALQETAKDWFRLIAAIRDELSADFASIYKHYPEENELRLLASAAYSLHGPHSLNTQDKAIFEILQSGRVFSGDRERFSPAFSEFQGHYLIVSSLNFNKKPFGLFVVSRKRALSISQTELFSAKVIQLSLLLAIHAQEHEKQSLLEKIAAQANRLKSAHRQILEAGQTGGLARFAGGIAHEINTPLGAIQMYAEYLQIFLQGKAEQDSAEGILKAVRLLRNVVENVTWLSMQNKLEFTPISLKRVWQDALTLLEPFLEKGQVEVEFRAFDNPFVLGNHAALVQVLTNVLHNAKDSVLRSRLLSRKGLIQVRLGEDEETAFMEVADNGPGIPEEFLGRIFEPFFSTKEVGKGQGLGLCICQAIVQEHHGTMEVVSEEGKGTRVSVRLPIEGERFPKNGGRKFDGEAVSC